MMKIKKKNEGQIKDLLSEKKQITNCQEKYGMKSFLFSQRLTKYKKKNFNQYPFDGDDHQHHHYDVMK
ncbi:hypothetical protein DERF_003740 [Dermatophagoides farinae]|uniref:Uncharacterized protein n=1 Tax=Dermatophagoides farinae TaxID=6954 RepID=A0A922LBQ8_DERFA|nr:hypothetical protein DERF_003740 [Dermatophagoides farinae]